MQSVVGDYRLIATLGRGGMAEVFLAVRGGMAGFHKLVVIKRLRSDLLAQPQAATYRALLLDEARLAARLSHPHIVQTFEVGDQQAQPWLAMEYLDGQPLSQVVNRARQVGRSLPDELAIQVIIDALAGLAYAHDLADFDGTPLRIVHRDVSPQNVFWTYDGAIKLVDFGIAKFAHNTADTEVGIVKGKLTYMAPEQARGRPIDRRADLFVVGILLWELLAGQRLLCAPTQVASLQRLLFERLPSLASVRPDLDPALVRICDRALERDVTRRYATAGEMRADLERVLADRAPRRADLEAFIRPLFVDERAEITRRIRDAIAGHEPISLSPAEPPATDRKPAASHTHRAPIALPAETDTTAAPAGLVIDGPAVTPGRRRWLIGLGIAVVAVSAVDVLLWRQPDRASAAQLPPVVAPDPRPAAAAVGLPPVEPPALQLCGAGTIGADLAPALVEAFLRNKGAATITRTSEPEHVRLSAHLAGAPIAIDVRAAGSATAFQDRLPWTCDVGMASRTITDPERAQLSGAGDPASPVTEHVIGLDGIAVIVHPSNPLGALDRSQLHDVFTGKLTDWSQLGGAPGPITIRARDTRSGAFDTFNALVLGGDPLAPGASRFADSRALSDQVAGDPSAIGFIGLADIRSTKALAVGDQGTAARLPASFTVATEDYLLSRRLSLYTPPAPRTPLVTELVRFVLSPAGQAVVRDTGFTDLTIGLRDGEPCDTRCPRAYAALIAHARRLSLDFRFRSGSDEVDSRAIRDLDRVVQFLRDHPGAKLMLLGFSDPGGAASASLKLSQHRAATIARELEQRGVHAQRVEGFGSAMPIASSAGEADRQRNRRVEVWLETAH